MTGKRFVRLIAAAATPARPARQVSNFRRLDGIDGRVDWNVARP